MLNLIKGPLKKFNLGLARFRKRRLRNEGYAVLFIDKNRLLFGRREGGGWIEVP